MVGGRAVSDLLTVIRVQLGLLCLAVFVVWPHFGGFWIKMKQRHVFLFFSL